MDKLKLVLLLTLCCFGLEAGGLSALTLEESSCCHAAAINCSHEDTRYVRKTKLPKADILRYLTTPRTIIDEKNKDLLKQAEGAIEAQTLIGGAGTVIAPWENMSGAFLGSLSSIPMAGQALDITNLFALAFVRGIEPFQALYKKIVGDLDFSSKMHALSLEEKK